MKRIQCGKVISNEIAGPNFPLADTEEKVVVLLSQMAHICMKLCISQSIWLDSLLVQNMEVQERLNAFNNWVRAVPDEKVGTGYWMGFLHRHRDHFTYKRGQKYKMDRSNWMTYCNFFT